MEGVMFGDLPSGRKHPWLPFVVVVALGVIGLALMWGLMI
jgi:hypothetical protein